MITSIHQPSFFPWLGLLDKIAKSDYFVFLDDVHPDKGSNQYRNTFFCNGTAKYIGLPVDYNINSTICGLNFKNDLWKIDHLNKIKNYYSKSPYYNDIYSLLEELYSKDYEKPVDFIIASMLFEFKMFDIKVRTTRSSLLKYEGRKGDLVLNICKATNSVCYLSGQGGKNYMDDEIMNKFKAANVNVLWHHFKHPVYHQSPKFSFLEGLSSLDMLFWEGQDNAKRIFWDNVNILK